jgi:hypothetical protein
MKSGIIYKGPSLLDGKPIVVIATYSKRNAKTGAVVQTYILVDGINPLEASKTGADFSICGTCAMRGEVTTDPNRKQAKNRRCYVNLGQGVLIVYKSFLRGVYAMADNIAARKSIGRGRFVRGNLWRPRRRARRRVGRSSFRSRHFYRVQSSIGMASRHCNAIGRQSRASDHALASRTAHVSRNRGSRTIGQAKRSALSSVQRGWPARPVYRMQAL